MTNLSLERVRDLYTGTQELVSLDDVAEWVGKQKGSLKRTLCNPSYAFVEGEDWHIFALQDVKQKSDEKRGGHNAENIVVTIECFKELAMLAGTPKGKQVRRYFLTVERERHALHKERDSLRKERDSLRKKLDVYRDKAFRHMTENSRLRKRLKQHGLMSAAAETLRNMYADKYGDELSPQQYAAMARRCRERGAEPACMERGLYFERSDWKIVYEVIEELRARYRNNGLLPGK